jgi:hypothetical protein
MRGMRLTNPVEREAREATQAPAADAARRRPPEPDRDYLERLLKRVGVDGLAEFERSQLEALERQEREEREPSERTNADRDRGRREIVARLAGVDAAVDQVQRFLWDEKGGLRQLLAHVIADTLDEAGNYSDAASKKVVEALRAELQVEIAVLRDELVGRLDAKTFGAALTDDPEIAKRAIAELRATVASHTAAAGARLGVLAERIAKIEKRQIDADEVKAWLTSLQMRISGFSSATTSQIEKIGDQVERLAADAKELRALLAEAGILEPGPPAAAWPALLRPGPPVNAIARALTIVY